MGVGMKLPQCVEVALKMYWNGTDEVLTCKDPEYPGVWAVRILVGGGEDPLDLLVNEWSEDPEEVEWLTWPPERRQ